MGLNVGPRPATAVAGRMLGQQPLTWMQMLEQGLLGMNAQQVQAAQYQAPDGYPQGSNIRRDALTSGLMQAAMALQQPGGVRGNWGNALLAGVMGSQQAAQAGAMQNLQLARQQRFRQVIAGELARTTDPNQRIRLEAMLADPQMGYIAAPTKADDPDAIVGTYPHHDGTGRFVGRFGYTRDGRTMLLDPGWSQDLEAGRSPREEQRPTLQGLADEQEFLAAFNELVAMGPDELRGAIESGDPEVTRKLRLAEQKGVSESNAQYNQRKQKLLSMLAPPAPKPEDPSWWQQGQDQLNTPETRGFLDEMTRDPLESLGMTPSSDTVRTPKGKPKPEPSVEAEKERLRKTYLRGG